MKIAVVGTRGIPASYSGFETCVQETVGRFVSAGHQVTVYCRDGRTREETGTTDGIELVNAPFLSGKFTETISHTAASILHVARHRPDVVQVYGAGNGWWVPILKAMGLHVVLFLDGLDWERAKWGRGARAFLRGGAAVGSRFADYSVADSHHVIERMKDVLPDRSIEFVPYGAKTPGTEVVGKLEELGLDPEGYFIFVGRFVPEKNVHLLVEAFAAARTGKKLLVVGGSQYDSAYEKRVRAFESDRIIFPGTVFGAGYEELLRSCYAYVQPSALEGTSPSLLAAMGAGAAVLVSDIPENQETVADAGVYFRTNDAKDLARMIEHLDTCRAEVLELRERALSRVREHYSWDVVADRILRLSHPG